MLDFEIQRCTRRCSLTDRELKPGETIYSAIVARGADVVRLDFAQDTWAGEPDGTIGWWRFQVPDASGKKMHWAPNDVMLHYFEQLAGQNDKQDVRYVLALLMVRRRILRLEENGQDEQGRDLLKLFCPRNETQYEVSAALPDESRMQEIQTDLAQLLSAPAA